jgi:phytoene desaturase
MLYLGLDRRYDEVAHHSIFLAQDYRRNIAEIESGLPVSAPSFYAQNAGVTDGTLAPPGCSTLYMLVPVANLRGGGIDWPAIKAQVRQQALERLRLIGIEDVERHIVFEKVLTPTDWRDDMAIHHGATFNLAHTLNQMLHMRPRNRFEDLDGVYLVGGGTHPGSGLPVIFESARITSRLLAEDLGLDGGPPITTDLSPEPFAAHEPYETSEVS